MRLEGFRDAYLLASILQMPPALLFPVNMAPHRSKQDRQKVGRQVSLPYRSLGYRGQEFATTTEYFQYVVGQDLEQLDHQPNSTVGLYDAKNKCVAFKVHIKKTLIGHLGQTFPYYYVAAEEATRPAPKAKVTLGGYQRLFCTTNRKLNLQRSDNFKFSIITARTSNIHTTNGLAAFKRVSHLWDHVENLHLKRLD